MMKWTKKDVQLVRELYSQGIDSSDIETIMEIPHKKMNSKAKRWTEKEIIYLYKLCNIGKYGVPEMAKIMERSKESVQYKVNQLGLNKLIKMRKKRYKTTELPQINRREELKDRIDKMFYDGDLPEDICDRFNITLDELKKIAEELGIPEYYF